jgi:TPP-dependent pyruvate/acetoin dehydrogenase alpha subunit
MNTSSTEAVTSAGAERAAAVRLFRDMKRIRMVEETIASRYSEQEMRCPVHLSVGQEAAAVGVCSVLRQSDQVMSGHRSHAHYLAKGGDLDAMIAEIYGRETGCCRGRGGSMHLVDRRAGFVGAVPIVGSTIPIATGLAFADKLMARDRVTVAFLGEAATEQGVFHESMNFAALHRLPLVFACENNLYSVYSHIRVRQPVDRPVFHQAAAHRVPAEQVDGNDPMAVAGASSRAVDRARGGGGPSFLELLTYRWREHCGPGFDNHIGYRTEAEYLDWRQRDPVVMFEARLSESGVLDAAAEAEHAEEVVREIQSAFAKARSAPFPSAETLMHFIHSTAVPGDFRS